VWLVARTLAIVGLVLLILLLVVPLGIAMAMSPCPDCAVLGTQHIMQACFELALIASLMLLFPTTRLTPVSKRVPLLLLLDPLERPPRPA
jgi:hypothetical protein